MLPVTTFWWKEVGPFGDHQAPTMTNEQQLAEYFDRLWPICRSITGEGLRKSLDILGEIIPLKRYELPTGTPVLDWIVPREWNIRDAWIRVPDGRIICRLTDNNLHVVSYSVPVHQEMTLEQLRPHLHILRTMPGAIPYITSYYKENWGFCLSAEEFDTLPAEGTYEVFIDSTLADGSMSYAEYVLPGTGEGEVLISTYLCHPSMANNELSGPLAAAFVARELMQGPPQRLTYRFLFIPETIGAIAYLAEHGERLREELVAGYVLTCCGDRGPLTYKHSRRHDSLADKVALHVLRRESYVHATTPFAVGGSDERQYCSPGFNLPVGSIMRTPYQRYAEYHTSLDNRELISFGHLAETIEVTLKILRALSLNKPYIGTIQYGEPQLGRRGLYPQSASPEDTREALHRMLHLLNFADGATDLLETAERRNESLFLYESAIQACRRAGLIEN